MSGKHIVVQGATLKCKFSEKAQTDILKVKSQSKHFANDKDVSKKLIATTKETGKTLEKNTFGNCRLITVSGKCQTCQFSITHWDNPYDKVTLSNQGKILLEDSKAACPVGGPGCITVVKHGQQAEPSKQNVKNARELLSNQINPLVDIVEFKKSLEEEDSICE